MLFLWSIHRPIQGTQRSKPLLICSREDHSFLKLMVFAFYAGKLWNVLICSGHQLLHRLSDEDVYPLWTSCQFISLRDRESYCFPLCLPCQSSTSLIISPILSFYHTFLKLLLFPLSSALTFKVFYIPSAFCTNLSKLTLRINFFSFGLNA